MNAKEISNMLANQAELVCMHLLPRGKKQGKRWFAGSIAGDPGNSLVVDLVGSKAGIWSDFKEPNHRGDLLELWQCVRQISFVETLKEVKQYLGVSDSSLLAVRAKTFIRPEKPKCKKPDGMLLDYLISKRKIPESAIERYKIAVNANEIIFPIFKDLELVNVKYLTPRKTADEKNKWRQESNAEPCLFGWHGIEDNHRSVVITEGEIDCLSVSSVISNLETGVLSIPSGASNLEWLEYDYQNLERFDDIVLMLDMDEAGQKNLREIATRLGLERVRIAKLPLKDANEMLCADRTQELLKSVEGAEYIAPEHMKDVNHYKQETFDLMNGVDETTKGKTLVWQKTHDRIELHPAEISIWTGFNGHGKSVLLGYVMLGMIEQGEKFCLFSGEMLPKYTLERLLKQLTATGSPTDQAKEKAFQFLENNLWIYDVIGDTDVDEMLNAFTYGVKRYGIKNFIIDSLMCCRIDDEDLKGQKSLMDKLNDFKMRHNVHIHLIAHARKGMSEERIPGKMDVKGSGVITDKADNMFSIWRNKKKETALSKNTDDVEAKESADVFISCEKQRRKGWEGKVALWFNDFNKQYFDTPRQQERVWLNWEK